MDGRARHCAARQPPDRRAGLAVGLVAASLAATTARAEVELRFEPASVELAPGASALVSVLADGVPAEGLAAFQLELPHDAAVAELLDPNAGFAVEPFAPLAGNPLCAAVRDTPVCEDPDWMLTGQGRSAVLGLVDAAVPGELTVVYGTLADAPASNGTGALMMLQVTGVAEGAASIAALATLAAATSPPRAYAAAGQPLTVTVGTPPDADGDGIADSMDNCTAVANPSQYDSNGDGYGNLCDPDINDDGVVNFSDLGALKEAFFAQPASPNWNPHADFNNDASISFFDLGVLKGRFFQPPGPSGLAP